MTEILIQEQIKDIKTATEKASKSKKTAIEFLVAAGIIQITPPLKPVLNTKNIRK